MTKHMSMLGTLEVVACVMLFGGFAGAIFGIGYGDRSAWGAAILRSAIYGILLGLVGGATVEAVRWSAFNRRQREGREASQRASDEAARRLAKEAEEGLTRSLDRQRDQIRSQQVRAVQLYASLPTLLSEARRNRNEAQAHFTAGAFSPFWESIESGYNALGRFDAAVRELGLLAESYRTQVRNHRSTRLTDAFEPFPVTVDGVAAARAGKHIASHLGTMVYQAQQHPVYSQIWEQRRTTAATETGFANLGEAVKSMGAGLNASIASLGLAVGATVDRIEAAARTNSERVEVAIRANTSAVETTAAANLRNSADQAEAIHMLTHGLDTVVFELEDAYRRDTGWPRML